MTCQGPYIGKSNTGDGAAVLCADDGDNSDIVGGAEGAGEPAGGEEPRIGITY